MSSDKWPNLRGVAVRSYRCGFCDTVVGVGYGYPSKNGLDIIAICPYCENPSYLNGNEQVPGSMFGNSVAHLPPNIQAAYDEARRSMAASAYTGAVLLCRKLLMHIAVAQGAKEGESFKFYVDFLAQSGYIPPNGRRWVDHIRLKGNEATHEISLASRADAEQLLTFLEMLLRFIYEFPAQIPSKP